MGAGLFGGVLRDWRFPTLAYLAFARIAGLVLPGRGPLRSAQGGAAAYGAALLFYLAPGSDPIYLNVTGLRTVVTYGGATYRVAEGVPNQWGALEYICVLVMLSFTVDASLPLWRRGRRRRPACCRSW